MKCAKCNQEFTEQDKKDGNFRQGLWADEMIHRECPDEQLICHICGEPVEKSKNVGTKAWPRHEGCFLNLKPEETEAEPSSWIVRR